MPNTGRRDEGRQSMEKYRSNLRSRGFRRQEIVINDAAADALNALKGKIGADKKDIASFLATVGISNAESVLALAEAQGIEREEAARVFAQIADAAVRNALVMMRGLSKAA